MAGLTVTFLVTPIEHVKSRLQLQYQSKANSLYQGPIDCARKIYHHHGMTGIYRGLTANLIFRSFFFFWWSSYDVLTRLMSEKTTMSLPAINFVAGGLSAQVFWITAYPSDVVKQWMMADPLGGRLGDGKRRFPRWIDAVKGIHQQSGWRGYWRGFMPCFLRAFPANAAAILAYETAMRHLP